MIHQYLPNTIFFGIYQIYDLLVLIFFPDLSKSQCPYDLSVILKYLSISVHRSNDRRIFENIQFDHYICSLYNYIHQILELNSIPGETTLFLKHKTPKNIRDMIFTSFALISLLSYGHCISDALVCGCSKRHVSHINFDHIIIEFP